MAIRIRRYFCPHCKGEFGTIMCPMPKYVEGQSQCPRCMKPIVDPNYRPKKKKSPAQPPPAAAAPAAGNPGINFALTSFQPSWLEFAVGATILVAALAWSVYLVKDGFNWWVLGSGCLALFGLGIATKAMERFGEHHRNLWIGSVVCLGLIASTIYLLRDGFTYWSLPTGIMALLLLSGLISQAKGQLW